ncbi:hypothetical protein [Nitratidesulfovibrio liaohensis]|uniref:Uncharacterized protein n=1 Tax=Nitratidesulfovibrio liaohensis TaxID=2604158 RepID=A0ABY9R1W1_9BACT|nr:hypothetical protein [Nitratidesulfovibrio liaohensis]WMW65740.1 hypothetical protein KPS_000248 [Nitratidesulfovibrio liaohensis]
MRNYGEKSFVMSDCALTQAGKDLALINRFESDFNKILEFFPAGVEVDKIRTGAL